MKKVWYVKKSEGHAERRTRENQFKKFFERQKKPGEKGKRKESVSEKTRGNEKGDRGASCKSLQKDDRPKKEK